MILIVIKQNVTKDLEPVSSKISNDRPLVNQITKESNLYSNAKYLDLNRKILFH